MDKLVTSPNCMADVYSLIDAYIGAYGHTSFLRIEPRLAKRAVQEHILSGRFFCAIYNDKEIQCFGICDIGLLYPWSYKSGLVQKVFVSTQSGVKAVRHLRMFHNQMIKYAKTKKLSYCHTSSMLPTKATFNRILQKDGWREIEVGLVFEL